MASDGPNFSGTIASVAGGTQPWNNPSNAGANDSNETTSGAGGANDTEFLACTNFGFSIPAGAMIDGIEVAVEKNRGPSPIVATEDQAVHLIKGGAIQSGASNKAVSGDWGSTPFVETYGGPTDTWSVSLVDTDVTASNFGVAFQAVAITGLEAEVDYVTMTVYYTAGATGELVGRLLRRRVARTHEPIFEYWW